MIYTDPKAPTSSGKKRILLAHPHNIVCDGLSRVINESEFTVVNHVDSFHEIPRECSESEPDILLIDFQLVKDRLSCLGKLKNDERTIIAVVAPPENMERAQEAINAGAKGFLSYTQSKEEFLQSLALLETGSFIIASINSKEMPNGRNGQKILDILSEREYEVIKMIAHGATNREIADKLMVSQHTVKIHLHNILNKVDLRNRQQLAAYAAQQGLVEDLTEESTT